MVRVRERAGRDRPGIFPVHAVLIDQQPHQLGHRDRGMSVVELDREFLVKARQRDLLHAQDAHHVLQ